jgi:tRNA (adenine22-N1)-methyltransferase
MSSKLPALSLRLQRLLTLAGKGEDLWDIGCDHGLIGRWIRQLERYKCVHFVDPAPKVIERLKKTLDADIPSGSSYEIHKKRAHEIKVQKNFNTFLMAGFGGQGMLQGLRHLKNFPESRVIISPHRDILAIRAYLSSEKWGLELEEILSESGQFYQILVLSQKADKNVSLYGKEQWASKDGQQYLDHLLEKLPLHQNSQDQDYLNYLRSLRS